MGDQQTIEQDNLTDKSYCDGSNSPNSIIDITMDSTVDCTLLEIVENPTEKLLQQFIKLQMQKGTDLGPPRSQTFPLTDQKKDVPCRFISDGNSPNQESLSPVISELVEENGNEVVVKNEQKEHELPTLVEEDGSTEDKKEDISSDDENKEISNELQTEELKIETPDDKDVIKKKGLWSRFKHGITRSFRSKKPRTSQKGSHSVETLPSEQVKPIDIESPDSAPDSDREDIEPKKVKKQSKVSKLFRRLSLRKTSKKTSDIELTAPESEESSKKVEINGQKVQRPTTLPQALFNIANPYNKKNQTCKTSSRLPSATSPNDLDDDDEDDQICYVAKELFRMACLQSPDDDKTDAELKSAEQELAEYLRKCGDQFNEENKATLKSMFVKVLDSDKQDSQPSEKIARLFLFSTETAFLVKNVGKHLSSLLLKSTAEFVEDKFAYLLTGKDGWGTVMNEASDSDGH